MKDFFFVIGLAVVMAVLMVCCASLAHASEIWKVTYYSNDLISCGKTDGVTASGRIARPKHTAAVNWLPFGTRIKVGGRVYVVEDHGARSLFGSKRHHIRHVDIFCKTRNEALKNGIKWLPVEIL